MNSQTNYASRRRKPIPISLTPLIDVVFILLIFFMLATRFSQERVIDVQAPDSAPAKAVSASRLDVRSVTIIIHNDGSYEIDGVLFNSKDLEDVIGRDLASTYIIRLSENTEFQSMIRVIDIFNSHGVQTYKLVER